MKKLIALMAFLLSIVSCYPQGSRSITASEQKGVEIINSFISYLGQGMNSKSDITDSAHLQYLLIHFLFTNEKNADSIGIVSGRKPEQLSNLRKDIKQFYNYLAERKRNQLSANIIAVPIKTSGETDICKRLSAFQQENTFVLYDKRSTARPLAFILMIPVMKDINTNPKIWSWTLMYKFGKYAFRSIIGEEGYELIFEK